MKFTFWQLVICFFIIIVANGCGKNPVPIIEKKQEDSANKSTVDITKKQIEPIKKVLTKDRDTDKNIKKNNGFLLAGDISEYISKASGDNENEKIVNGISRFTDDFFDYYIDLFKSKSVYSKIDTTEKAIQKFQSFKNNCGIHQIKNKYSEIEHEAQPASRKYKLGELKTIMTISSKAKIPNTFNVSLYRVYLKTDQKFVGNVIVPNSDGVMIHNEVAIKEIVAELVNQIQKIKFQ